MSEFADILLNIRDCLNNSEEFKGVEVYFDDSEMNPNIKLPAISFKVNKKKVIDGDAFCTTYSREVEIRLHTKTLDKRQLQEELYDYEEDLVTVLNRAKLNNTICNNYELVETKSSGIGALMWNARQEGGQFNKIFFSNIIRVYFNIIYKI